MDTSAIILVIDDDPSLLSAMARVLKTAGNTVLEAATGAEGFILAKKHRPDVMIVDLMLPDMDGLEVCRRVRAATELAEVETILISSIRTSSEDQADGFATGVCEYIARPMPNREFLARVEARVREKKARNVLKAARDAATSKTSEQAVELERAAATLQETILLKDQEKQGRIHLEEELQTIFTHAPICLLLTDGEARLHKANPAVVELFGSETNTVLGHPCGTAFGCVHVTDHPAGCGFGPQCSSCAVRRAITDTFTSGKPHLQVETTLNSRQEGRIVERMVRFSTSPVMIAGERRVFVCLEDITEQKRAVAALLASDEKSRFLADMLQSSSQPFATGTADGQLVLVNRAYCELVGYSDEELRSIKWNKDLTPPEYLELDTQVIAQLVATGQPLKYEKEYIHKDGRRIPLELLADIRKSDGEEADVFYAFFTDLTERKRHEQETKKLNEQLFQAQKMESVGRLAGGVAHDFNNMLSVILGYSQMALEKTDKSSPIYSDLQEVHEAAERSANITRQLLAFARKQAIAPQLLDLNESIEGMLKMIRRLIGEDIDLIWRPAKDLPAVKIDPSQVDQVLANLCVNARDAIASVGTISIETDRATLDEAYCATHLGAIPGHYVLLAVSDNGQGIEKEVLDKIFEPFFTTKELGQGTGLGLATVYGIVKQNNGFINVYSEAGRGTTFKIYLPQHTEEARAGENNRGDEALPGSGQLILIVEDEELLLKLTARMLTDLGYEALRAKTPAEAIRLTKEHGAEIDLLLVDVIMPEMNGRDLVAALADLQPNLKYLFMSGYTYSVIAAQGVVEEEVHFLQKPFSAKALAAKVREALAS